MMIVPLLPTIDHIQYPGLVGDGTEVLRRTPTHLDDYDSDDKEEYFLDMETNESNIRNKFIQLVVKTFDSFKNDTTTLRIFFLEYFKTNQSQDVDDLSKQFKQAENHADIHAIATKYFSFYNTDPIELLIKNHGTSEDKQNLKDYNSYFRKYVITVKNNGVICGPYVHGKNKVTFKLNLDENNPLPAKTTNKFKRKICEILGIRMRDLYLRRIRGGCIEFDFLVSDEVCGRLCRVTAEMKQGLYQEKVTFVETYCPHGKVRYDFFRGKKIYTFFCRNVYFETPKGS